MCPLFLVELYFFFPLALTIFWVVVWLDLAIVLKDPDVCITSKISFAMLCFWGFTNFSHEIKSSRVRHCGCFWI